MKNVQDLTDGQRRHLDEIAAYWHSQGSADVWVSADGVAHLSKLAADTYRSMAQMGYKHYQAPAAATAPPLPPAKQGKPATPTATDPTPQS